MRPAHTMLFTTTLLGALIGCAAQTAEEAAAASHSMLDANAAGLSVRPKNSTCLAGPVARVPQKLSQLGCFDAASSSLPGPGLVPYDVNAPLWSDDADKQRWLAIPDGTSITVDAEGHFVLPKGAVVLKTFMREGQRLETRVWMNHPDAGWQGYSYRWEAPGRAARP